ncbi:hypothetical protein AGIG_G8877 [Arapaima gigas]
MPHVSQRRRIAERKQQSEVQGQNKRAINLSKGFTSVVLSNSPVNYSVQVFRKPFSKPTRVRVKMQATPSLGECNPERRGE